MEKNLRKLLWVMLSALLFVACDDDKPVDPNSPDSVDGPVRLKGGVFTIVEGDTIVMDGSTYELSAGASSWVIDLYSNGMSHHGGMTVAAAKGLEVQFVGPDFSWDTYPEAQWRATSCMASDRNLEQRFMSNPVYHQQIEIKPVTDYMGARSIEIKFEPVVKNFVWQTDTKFVVK